MPETQVIPEEETKAEITKGDNIILIYGYPPERKVIGMSFIATSFFEMLSGVVVDNEYILIPDDNDVFTTWIPNGHRKYFGEKIVKIA